MANWDKINHLKNAISLRSVEENVEEDALLAHDALVLIANATYDAMRDSRWNITNSSRLTKTDLLKEYILKARIHGVTGDISINSHFVREVKELQVLNLLNNKPVQIGKWTSSAGTILSQKMYINFETDICKQPPLEGHTLRVTVLEVHPYVIKYNKSGSIAYKGFCIDLLDEIARDLKFKYVIEEVPDQQYGALIDGKWNGMIQQLIDKEVDISGAPLAITEVREKVVDFTIAYQHYTNDLLFSRPYNVYDMFAFIMPLSHEIWYCLAGTVLIVGVLTFLLNYLSPYGWKDENGQGTAKEMSLFNSVWFAFSCILQQGTSDRPKTLSGRVFSGVYWFCVLIFVSTYTANLTAFFTAKSATTTIKNLQDLIMDSEKDIGVLYASSSYSFFEHATYEQFQQLWSRMKTFPNSTQQAIEWAKNKNFVYIEASPIIEYAAAQNCDLMTAPGLSNTQGLAFALPQGSIYRDNMTLSLLRMEVSRFIQNRKDYWWSKNTNCHEFNAGSLESKEVKVSHMLGVYVLFGCGCLLAIIALFAEILWDRRMRGKVATVPPESTNDIGTKADSPGNQSQHHTDLISLNSFS